MTMKEVNSDARFEIIPIPLRNIFGEQIVATHPLRGHRCAWQDHSFSFYGDRLNFATTFLHLLKIIYNKYQ